MANTKRRPYTLSSNNPGREIVSIFQQDRERQTAFSNSVLDDMAGKVAEAYKSTPSLSGAMMDALGIYKRRGVGPGRMPEPENDPGGKKSGPSQEKHSRG